MLATTAPRLHTPGRICLSLAGYRNPQPIRCQKPTGCSGALADQPPRPSASTPLQHRSPTTQPPPRTRPTQLPRARGSPARSLNPGPLSIAPLGPERLDTITAAVTASRAQRLYVLAKGKNGTSATGSHKRTRATNQLRGAQPLLSKNRKAHAHPCSTHRSARVQLCIPRRQGLCLLSTRCSQEASQT